MFRVQRVYALYFVSGIILGLFMCVLFQGNAYTSYRVQHVIKLDNVPSQVLGKITRDDVTQLPDETQPQDSVDATQRRRLCG